MVAEKKNELNELATLIAEFGLGRISSGVFYTEVSRFTAYPQRELDKFFVRVRLRCGVISSTQLEDLAWISQTWGTSRCHLTTRQCIEIHGLALSDLAAALGALADAGLDPMDAAGASIRNVVVCPHAGAKTNNPMDVMPFAKWLADYVNGHPGYRNLPKRINIGVACCHADCARTLIQDIGFQARTSPNGDYLGFRVVVGGGLGASPRAGQTLIEFMPAVEILLIVDAILKVFDRLGDRKNHANGRLKFLIGSMGIASFRLEVLRELDQLKTSRSAHPPLIPFSDDIHDWSPSAAECSQVCQLDESDYLRWEHASTSTGCDGVYRTIHIPVPGGSLNASQLRGLADIVRIHQLGVRITPEQGILLRGVTPEVLEDVHEKISSLELDYLPMGGSLVSCPGAATCPNAFTNCHALCKAVLSRLQADNPTFEQFEGVRIKISGCLNGCSQHAIADIGLEGTTLSRGDKWLPAYRVCLGGEVSQEKVEFGRQVGVVPSRQVPALLADMLACYRLQRVGSESFSEVLRRVGYAPFSALVELYAGMFDLEGENFNWDWGSSWL